MPDSMIARVSANVVRSICGRCAAMRTMFRYSSPLFYMVREHFRRFGRDMRIVDAGNALFNHHNRSRLEAQKGRQPGDLE